MNQPWWRPLRRWLTGHPPARTNPLSRQFPAWATAQTLVRAYYAALLYLAFTSMPTWAGLAAGRSDLGLLWPVVWTRALGMGPGLLAVMALYLGGSFAAAVAPANRICRGLAALGMLEFTAFEYSAGKIGHSSHLWVLTALILVFLPKTGVSAGRRERQDYLNVFWTAHALILLTYTMSGLGKVAGALYQSIQGQVTAFHPQALALHVVARLAETGSQSPVGDWLVDHSWVGWPLMLGAIYLQTFAFWSIFRPRLLRVWTIGLIAFHLATFFVLTIRFAPPVLLLALWGLASPFAPSNSSLGDILADLPLFGTFFGKASLGAADPNQGPIGRKG
jgi:hypothetical protein